MALPPEQINIKRRREEEPVETLFIQSALHQTKRRFTDFVFHRVTLKASESGNGDASPSPPATPAVQRLLKSPRSVSSLHVNRRTPASSMGVPMVRATSPGAEFREAQRITNARKEAEENHRRAVYGGPSPFTDLQPSSAATSDVSYQPAVRDSSPASVETSSSRAQALRRFQISRSNLDSLRSSPGGIQKRRAGGPAPGVAVLVEQLQRNAHSRKASMVSDLVAEARTLSLQPKELVQDTDTTPPSPVKPRKRPVVNHAERRWREERKVAISAAKQHLSDTLEKSAQTQQRSWEQESERLAHDLEQVALELEREADQDHVMDLDPRIAGKPAPPPPASLQHAFSTAPKPPLKHQPRQPKEPRVAPTTPQSSEVIEQAVEEEDDDEGDYVYDVYVRRPLSEAEMLKNPLAEYESDQQQKDIAKAQPGVGVIVITAEDEEYWDDFIEDDEEEWDSEDADSNAENNPANDYPDEEASSDEDNDDFDFDDSASEDGGTGYMSRYRGHVDSDEDY
ncbi:Transcription factor Iwr1 [Penicillium expansum]|uniref:Transcription factor Iwr1 n=1 Tax=Penicillium expansum TaxID=27334 RepID=A0A0A2LA19_PENEN|nr:Transcription factor Iwr1 [Penicillium expansum]KGO43605.1 Transcription factor Iwr1 [Penicillium expansum]KGO52815.1 Transcription factor Iwr1 [Penicillium expansum]KGO73465.1 Transcription factor Iwr1 [Penicillium expansum]